jgi:hypothetical protein
MVKWHHRSQAAGQLALFATHAAQGRIWLCPNLSTPRRLPGLLAQIDASPDSLCFAPIRIWPKPEKHNTSYRVDSNRGHFALRVRIASPDSAGFLFYERLMMR